MQSNPEIIHIVYFIGSNRNTSADLVEWAYNADCKTDKPVTKPPTNIPVSEKENSLVSY